PGVLTRAVEPSTRGEADCAGVNIGPRGEIVVDEQLRSSNPRVFAAGGIYASLALALVLIYRAMGLINFAQGEFAMFTAFICWALLQGAQLPFALAVAIAVGLGAAG